MLVKDGKDYVYFIRPILIEDASEEVSLYRDGFIEIRANQKKAPDYYRIIIINKQLNIRMLPETLLMTLGKKRLKNKVMWAVPSDNVIYCNYTFDNVGFIVFGKLCTEKNV